jgi:excisionase family DNA binding protein
MAVEQLERIGQYMTVREAARIKGTSVEALYQAIHLKNLPHSRIGRQILVRLEDLASYEARSKKV